MRTISQRELRNDSGKVLRDLQQGEELEVTVNGKSIGVLRLDPPADAPQRWVPAERWNAVISQLPAASEEERAAFTRDAHSWDAEISDPFERLAQHHRQASA